MGTRSRQLAVLLASLAIIVAACGRRRVFGRYLARGMRRGERGAGQRGAARGEGHVPAHDVGRRGRSQRSSRSSSSTRSTRARPSSRSSTSRPRPTTTQGPDEPRRRHRRRSDVAVAGEHRGLRVARRAARHDRAADGDRRPDREDRRLLPGRHQDGRSTRTRSTACRGSASRSCSTTTPTLFDAAGVAYPDDTWDWAKFAEVTAAKAHTEGTATSTASRPTAGRRSRCSSGRAGGEVDHAPI